MLHECTADVTDKRRSLGEVGATEMQLWLSGLSFLKNSCHYLPQRLFLPTYGKKGNNFEKKNRSNQIETRMCKVSERAEYSWDSYLLDLSLSTAKSHEKQLYYS